MNTITKGKIAKQKKQPAHFAADNIDNTAPLKKLLDDIHHKNSKAFAFYCHTIRQRRTTKQNNYNFHFTVTGHPLHAFAEDWDGDLNSGYFEAFTYKSFNPKMMTEMRHIGKCDPVSSCMKQKADWIRDTRSLRLAAASSSMRSMYENLNEDVVQCPQHFVDMAAHLDNDPDPYFDGAYNWYYAGNGNLQLISVNWVDYLLHSEFNTLYLSQFSKNDMTLDLDHAARFNCDEGHDILETICSFYNIIALRTKNKIYILKIVTANDKLEIENIKALESELSFTSISFDQHHKNILYVTNLACKLTIVNLDRLTGRNVSLKYNVTSLVDNWSAVISSARICYMHIARNSITLYDKRTNDQCQMWSGVRHITDDLGCNEITVAKQCEQSNSLYFGTDHHLFLMDVRNQNKSKPKIVQRWTHGMQSAPTYMSVCHFEYNKELICLSSQWCEDTCVVPNYTEITRNSEISGVTIPYRPPSILDTLNDARQKLLCFNLYNPIDSRLSTAITGNTIFERGQNYIILMQNSLGDISYHNLYPQHMETFIEDDSIQHLHEWSKSYQIEKTNFEVSSIEDFSNIWKKLKIVPKSHKIGEGKLMTSEKTKFTEQNIYDAFESKELDYGLLEVWIDKHDETTIADQSSSFKLFYSDSE